MEVVVERMLVMQERMDAMDARIKETKLDQSVVSLSRSRLPPQAEDGVESEKRNQLESSPAYNS
jgi:hypothetical protein